MKVKIYIMHSSKDNYVDEIYKPLLNAGIMKEFYLILPMSEKYIGEYVKDLLKDSDYVICFLDQVNFGLKLEIKYAKKLQKKIAYMADVKYKVKAKANNIYYYSNSDEMIRVIKNILGTIDKKQVLLNRENIYYLGDIKRTKNVKE